MNDLRRVLLQAAFPEGVPALVQRLLPSDWDPTQFGGGPILSSSGSHRFYIADQTDDPGFTATVLQAVPQAAQLLALAPPRTRRMVDTDGQRLDLYLDDLHLDLPDGERDESEKGDSAGSVMCEVLDHPSGARSRFRFIEQLPEGFRHLAPLQGLGRLLHRTGGRQSVLWVTEARWTGRAEDALKLAQQTLSLPPAWAALHAQIPGLYIDGIELHPGGGLDLTPGVLR